MNKKALFLGLCFGFGLLAQVAANEYPGYVTSRSGAFVMSGTGECWKSGIAPHDAVAPPECGGPVDSDGDGVYDDKDQCPGTPAGIAVDAVGCPLDSDGDGVSDDKDKCPNTPTGVAVDAVGCERVVAAPVPEREPAPMVVGDVGGATFEFDSARLTDSAKERLRAVAATLEGSEGTVRVVGHTDSAGPEAYNQRLSERRAQAAADYLASLGVDAARIEVVGKGESSPVADNATREGRARNRRVEISVNP